MISIKRTANRNWSKEAWSTGLTKNLVQTESANRSYFGGHSKNTHKNTRKSFSRLEVSFSSAALIIERQSFSMRTLTFRTANFNAKALKTMMNSGRCWFNTHITIQPYESSLPCYLIILSYNLYNSDRGRVRQLAHNNCVIDTFLDILRYTLWPEHLRFWIVMLTMNRAFGTWLLIVYSY